LEATLVLPLAKQEDKEVPDQHPLRKRLWQPTSAPVSHRWASRRALRDLVLGSLSISIRHLHGADRGANDGASQNRRLPVHAGLDERPWCHLVHAAGHADAIREDGIDAVPMLQASRRLVAARQWWQLSWSRSWW
jgi:hypothetical protein